MHAGWLQLALSISGVIPIMRSHSDYNVMVIGINSLVPLAGIEPALLAELDFESSASTNSATGAFGHRPEGTRSRSRRNIAGAQRRSTRASSAEQKHSRFIALYFHRPLPRG